MTDMSQPLIGKGYDIKEQTQADTADTYTEQIDKQPKILRSWKIKPQLADTLKRYSVEVGKDASLIVELALSEYIFNHPAVVNPVYSVVVEAPNVTAQKQEQEDTRCEVGKDTASRCRGKSCSTLIYQPRHKQPKEVKVCSLHERKFIGIDGEVWRLKK